MAPPPTPSGGWLNQRWHGIPRWGLIGGAGALILGIYVLKKRAAARSSSTVGGAGGTLPSDLSGYGYGGGSAGGGAGGVGTGTLPTPDNLTTPTALGLPTGGLSSGSTPSGAPSQLSPLATALHIDPGTTYTAVPGVPYELTTSGGLHGGDPANPPFTLALTNLGQYTAGIGGQQTPIDQMLHSSDPTVRARAAQIISDANRGAYPASH